MSDDDEGLSFQDAAAEARHWRLLARDRGDELEDLKMAFSDIQATSKELEEEMERDLAAMEKREHELRSDNERLKGEVDALKARHQSTLKEQSITLQHMQKELEELRSSEKRLRTRLRDMELDNDDLEKSERAISSTLGDMENRYNRAIERTALLEHELVDKARLEEELQRVKDELRDTVEELELTRSQRDEAVQTLESTKMTGMTMQTSQPADEGQRTEDMAPSPDIDSYDDHHSAKEEGSLNGGREVATTTTTTSPSLQPFQAEPQQYSADGTAHLRPSTPDNLSTPGQTTYNGHSSSSQPRTATTTTTSSSSTTSTAFIARSSNARNLSSLARKSLTPKDVRDKRGDAVISDMKDMASRMQNLRNQLNTRRESLMTSSAIPRPRASMLPTSSIPRSTSSTSSIASGSMARSTSLRNTSLTASPSKRDVNAAARLVPASSRLSARPPSRSSTGFRGSARPPSQDGDRVKVRTTRPPSRLSNLGTSRPATPSAALARSPTPATASSDRPSSQHQQQHVHQRSASRQSSSALLSTTPRRTSMGPSGRRVLNTSDQAELPGRSGGKSSSVVNKPLPAWR